MNRVVVAPFAVIVLTSSCAVFRAESPAAAPEVHASSRPAGSAKQRAKRTAPKGQRKVGDFFVHRFSGTALETPLVLTEEVVGQEDAVWIIDYALTEGEDSSKLQVYLDAQTERPIRVLGMEDGQEVELPLEAYDALLERTAFAADVNDGLIDASTGTCMVGPDELDCETKNYRVFIGDEEAKLSVTDSKRFSGRDIAGEITAPDGTVIYRAELIEAGSSGNSKGSVAAR